ncbi:hypothetical protein AHiyo8_62480 [Arthrobacter sp. Hiyo8]|nr:hypothetical protein AHiyo8_62480 [Arthrobacter sp. Hiyo8]
MRASPRAKLALTAVVAAHGIMVAVMSMTPLHLQELVSTGPVGAMWVTRAATPWVPTPW